MKRRKSPSPLPGNLRPQTEKRLKGKGEKGLYDANDLSRTDARALVHELQVHQIELEMQNEELHRAQAEAQEAQQKSTELFDFAPVGYFLVDQNGLVREANLAAAALVGWDRSRVSGQPFAKLIAPDCRPQFATFWSHLEETDTRQSCELTLLKQGQGARSVVLEAAVRSGLPGGGMQVLLAVTDITERKHAEEALQAAHRGLERRVEERTAELQRSNVRLAQEIEERKRAEENLAKQLHFETLIAELSAKFINLPAGEVGLEIMDAERRICELLDLDISAIWQWSAGPPGRFTLTHYYSAQDGPQPSMQLSESDFPWLRQLMIEGRIVPIASVEAMPAEAALDRENCRRLGIKSNLCLPLMVAGQPVGLLGLNTTRAERDWPDALVKQLQLLAQVFTNALARKHADVALRESEERLSLAVNSAQAGIWALNCRTQVFWASEQARLIFGYSPEEMLSLERFKASVHPDDWSLVQASLDRAVQADEPVNVEYRIRLGDGRERWIASRGRPFFAPSGEPERLLGLSMDITERKRGEEALRAGEARLAAGTELAGLGYYEVDYAGRTCFLDDRFREICGVPPEVQQGLDPVKFWLEHVHPDDRQFVLDERQELHGGKLDRNAVEYRYQHPAHGQKWIHHLACIVASGKTGPGIRTFGVVRDITRQKRAELEALELRSSLTHADRVTLLGQLASSLAHELSQPLGAILRNAEAAEIMLQAPSPDLEELRAIVTDILRDDQRAGQVIDRLRSLLKRRSLELQLIGLPCVIAEVLSLVQVDADARHVKIAYSVAPALPAVRGDRIHLQQVLINLLVNAMDALEGCAPDQRSIQVSAHQANPATVEVRVSDSGPGIPAESLARVFEPFFTTKAKGMGIGLPVSKTIVEAHQGRIWAENRPEGGACFGFTLSVARGEGNK